MFTSNMEYAKSASNKLARTSATPDEDYEAELLTGTRVPLVKIRPVFEHRTTDMRVLHSRGNSRELMPIDERSASRSLYNEAPDPMARTAATTRQRSPHSSGPSSLLRHLTTLRSPISPIFRNPSGRSRGGQYDELGDSEMDHVPVDLSSLAGMGYEMYENPNLADEVLENQDTAYLGPNGGRDNPHPGSFATRKNSRLGEGMVIGAELKFDPSKAIAERPKSSTGLERSKTVRMIGQNLAQEKQAIVAVKESVEDLSSLEGREMSHRMSHQTFDSARNSVQGPSQSSEPNTAMSFFYPKDPDVPNWRPFSMTKPYILMLTLLSLGLAIFQEFLCRHSQHLASQNKGILEFDTVLKVPLWDFFAWKYLPTMITILYAVLFSIMDFDIRRLEPYYQLSKPGGSRASASLNLDHLTMFQYFVPFKAFRLRQWAVFFSTIGNILASTITPALQNPSVMFDDNPKCHPPGDPNAVCEPHELLYFVRISPGWSRALSSALVITAAITAVILVLLHRNSGLQSDPKGIAGIASMATKSHILRDFEGMDLATRGKIHKQLQHRNFLLLKSSIWQGEWVKDVEPVQESSNRLQSPHPIWLQLSYGVPFIIGLFFVLGSIPLISFSGARVIPNAVPWLPILIATLLKMLWTTFESDVRLIEPFYRLSKGNAKPEESLTLDYQGTVYGWMPFAALANGHYILALVGLSSVLLDVLTVTISSFSVNSQIFLHPAKNEANQDETSVSFYTSVGLSMFIVIFVICTASLVYARRRHPFLPREPSTIAAILAFIYASNMLDDFVDTEHLTNRQMEARLKALNKRYALGWFKGRDGVVHCAIDEEPMRSKYKHGLSYKEAQAPWARERDDTYV